MPILLEGQVARRRSRSWVWLTALVAVLAFSALGTVAYLPAVAPRGWVGEWEYNYNGATRTCQYFADGGYTEDGNPTTSYRWDVGRHGELRLYGPQSRLIHREVWHLAPFGLRASVDLYRNTPGDIPGSGPIIGHRVLHPLTDWLPFLNR